MNRTVKSIFDIKSGDRLEFDTTGFLSRVWLGQENFERVKPVALDYNLEGSVTEGVREIGGERHLRINSGYIYYIAESELIKKGVIVNKEKDAQ